VVRRQVIERRLECALDAEAAFHAIYGGRDNAFWLDRRAGFSVMGDASGPLARVATYDAAREELTVDGRVHRTPFFDWLRADLAAVDVTVPELPFEFALGWVGALGYEMKRETGGEYVHHAETPDAWMIFADRALVFDHARHTIDALALAPIDNDTAARDWIDALETRLRTAPPLPPADAPDVGALGPLRLRHDRDAYTARIAACQEAIAAGESYEICLTNMIEADGSLDPWAAYRFLRRTNPAPFGAYLRCGSFSVLSSSPERMLHVDRDRRAESKPIKGTRPRGRDAHEDEQLRVELATDPKERAENLMIVDLVRNDLGRVAEVGSVCVEPAFAIETYNSVHQLVTTVQARLRPEVTATDCVRALFPAGSMTGAPKIRTMQIIDELEGAARGIYSGSIGFFSLSGAADFSVVIRTLVLLPNRLMYGTGGAITALSDADAEFEETAVKAAPILSLLGAAFPQRDYVQSPSPSATPW
jgi:para-aminobenzoate synthetase